MRGLGYLENLQELPYLEDVEDLTMSRCELTSIEGLASKCPNIQILDISHNQIFNFVNIEEFPKLSKLAELNLLENPICVNQPLKNLILRENPFIELYNNEEIHEVGFKLKQETEHLQRLIKEQE